MEHKLMAIPQRERFEIGFTTSQVAVVCEIGHELIVRCYDGCAGFYRDSSGLVLIGKLEGLDSTADMMIFVEYGDGWGRVLGEEMGG